MIFNYKIYPFGISIYKIRLCIYAFHFLVLQFAIVKKVEMNELKTIMIYSSKIFNLNYFMSNCDQFHGIVFLG
jgi:hypothetical protein